MASAESLEAMLEQLKHDLHEGLSKHSAFRVYSVGVVAENKPRTTSDVLVVPIEITPMIAGDLFVETEELENKGVDSFDIEYTVKIKHRNAIRCRWLQWGSNRKTAPDVRRGERVVIYRFADTDEFFWVSLGLDDHLRRLETVAWFFNANPDGVSNDASSPEDSYVLEVSTHDRLITLTTTKANEEPFAYTFQFNTAEGVVTLADDNGNYFEFDSTETRLTLHNADGTFFKLDKNDIFAYAPGNMDVEIEKDITVSCQNYTMSTKDAYKIDCTTYTLNASGSTEVTSPTITFNGDFTLNGNQQTSGSTQIGGSATIAGSTAVGSLGSTGGPLSVTSQIVTSEGISSSAPISGPNGSI